jgi:hypothetical protein
MSDEPLFPNPESSPMYAAEVIDLGDVRVEYGHPRYHHRRCEHKKLLYNAEERRIWCADCERTIEGFDAFKMLTRNFHAMLSHAKARVDEAHKLAAAQVHMKALKAVEKAWRGPNTMAVCCPHCSRGLLPEDFASGGSQMSRDLEMARRQREAARALKEPQS